jgi:CubicO group peptidase (beta-lactamase class C family)
MKKYVTFIITLNILLWFGLSNIAKAHHKAESHEFRHGISWSAPGSENYQKLETELVDNKISKLVDKQLQNQEKTGLASYVIFSDGKIRINKNKWNDEIKKNKGLLISNSVGKSMISYVTGHAVCKYGIDLNAKMNDWAVLNNTLYADNTLLQALNMKAGDHNIVGERKFRGDGFINGNKYKRINTKTITWNMQYFKDTKKKKENSIYNYSAMSTQVAINYVIHKIGVDNYENFLKEIFTDHVGVKNDVHFSKVSWSKADDDKGNARYTFFATAEDYIRIGKTLYNDYHSDSCIGDYLRFIYDNRVKKNVKDSRITNKHSAAATYEYGGQIHFSYKGMKKRVIFAMDGYGGQQLIIDMDNGTILHVGAIDEHYNWNKIVYNVMKKGL